MWQDAWYKCIAENVLSLYPTMTTFGVPRKKAFKNIVEKGENAGN